MITLLVMTDGRDTIANAIASADAMLRGSVTRRVIHDDSGDPGHAADLRHRHPDYTVISHEFGRQGFGGAIRNAWAWIRACDDNRFVFHLEDDFTFNHSVDVDAMAAVLDVYPHLAQLALRRQPWNAAELAAGGIIEQHPHDYTEQRIGTTGDGWLEHRRFFTTNPSLYRRTLLDNDWPDCPNSEGIFTHQLLTDPDLRFAFWGTRDSGEWVRHVGHRRVGTGY